jgi:hypothetical protein
MTRRTRYFLIGGALVLAAGLCTGLVAYYAGGLGPQGPDLDELSYLPREASTVAYADVRSIMASDVRERLRRMLPAGEERDRLNAELGIDIDEDIDSVVAGFVGGAPSPEAAVVLARGRFDQEQIEARILQHGGTAEDYRGRRLFVFQSQREKSGGVAFLESDLVALGDAGALRQAIDTAESSEDVTDNAELMRLVADVRGAHDAWIAGRLDTAAPGELPEVIRAPLAGVEWFTAGASVDEAVTGEVRAETRDDLSAQQLRDVIQGGLAAARLVSGQDKRLAAVLGSLQVAGSGRTVAIGFALSPELIDTLGELTPAPVRGRGPATPPDAGR